MKRVIILPLDDFASAEELITYLIANIFEEEDLSNLIGYIKLNDAVHNLDAGGPKIVSAIQQELLSRGLPIKVFLDLKIGDVSATVVNTLKKYATCPPDILTVSALCSVESIIQLRRLLPQTKLALLSALTDIGEEEFAHRYGMSPAVKIFNDLDKIQSIYKKRTLDLENWQHPEPFDLVVCSPKELPFLKRNLSERYEFVVPGIRDEWMKKPTEHQKRTTGVKEALNNGATFVVMGTQITKGNPAMNISAKESRLLTLQELEEVADNDNPLSLLSYYDGYYCSRFDEDGIVGPLVGYAGTYMTDAGPKNYVGYEYFNFAQAEQHPQARVYFADKIRRELTDKNITAEVFLGAPMGGIMLASELGRQTGKRSIFAEKEVLAMADTATGKKESSQQIIKRHDIKDGDNIIIVEDVCNNFSTTAKLQQLIEDKGGKLVAIACAINRSGQTEWNGLPVIASTHVVAKQFRQDEPAVSQLIATGNIVWKPKNDWLKLKQAMLK